MARTAGRGTRADGRRPMTEFPRIAYLVSHYPAISHTFIEREILGLRRAGFDIRTFSVRPTDPAEMLSETMRREHATTEVVLEPAVRDWAAAHLSSWRNHPGATVRGVASALRWGDRTPRAKLWQGFYYAEAVRLHHRLRQLGIRHIHVHHANVSADVARLVVAMGEAVDGPGTWMWTMTVHGSTEFDKIEQWDLAAKVRSARAVSCISDYCRGQLMRLTDPEVWPRLAKVPTSVDPVHFAPPAGGRPRDRDHVNILAVGRAVPVKGYPVLLEAMAKLVAAGVRARLRIVGDGPQIPLLRDLASTLKLDRDVELVGAVGQDHILDHFHWADVFVLSSFMEGLPVVIMEAMATGLPVVASRVAAIPELVNDTNGILVPMARADALADALGSLAGDVDLRESMGEAGRNAVEARHDIKVVVPQMEKFHRAARRALQGPLA